MSAIALLESCECSQLLLRISSATFINCALSYLSTKGKTMQKMVLSEVFEFLQQIGGVSSESEFSRD